jgi:hypothetical protein
MKQAYVLALLAMLFGIVACSSSTPTEEYVPSIQPADFSASITNPYFSLPEGRQLTYMADTEDGLQETTVDIKGTKIVAGVETRIYAKNVLLEGELVEEADEYYAQDKEGNVWIFGEETSNYEQGLLLDHEGTWMAGMDGAQPGIAMKATPAIGDQYTIMYAPDVGKDIAEVLAIDTSITTAEASYDDCVKIYGHNSLDEESIDHEYYCKSPAARVLAIDLFNGEREELQTDENH